MNIFTRSKDIVDTIHLEGSLQTHTVGKNIYKEQKVIAILSLISESDTKNH